VIYLIIVPEFWSITLLGFVKLHPDLIVPPKSIIMRTMFRRAIKYGTNNPGKTVVIGVAGAFAFFYHEYKEDERFKQTQTNEDRRHYETRADENRRFAMDKLDTELPADRKTVYEQMAKTGKFPK
jgi:hypothetical protein